MKNADTAHTEPFVLYKTNVHQIGYLSIIY